MIYAITDGNGHVRANVAFRDAGQARDWFEAVSERAWKTMCDEDGLPRAAAPTIEWRSVDAPEWAAKGEAWMAVTGGTPDDVGEQPHVVGLELFEG